MVRREDIKVGVLRIEGTNSEDETADAFRACGAQAELVHMNQLDASRVAPGEHRRLEDYHALVFPGGFSAGDYIRAGAIWAARFKARHGKDLEAFVAEGKPVGGICNGFQVLVELGLLPAVAGELMAPRPRAALHLNDSDHYECRPVLLEHTNGGSCAFTGRVPRGAVVTSVASHAEGKLLLGDEAARRVRELEENDQIVFRYVGPDGEPAGYPWNPSGTTSGIAGLTNAEGNVFGMMPHPERVFHRWQHPDWTRTDADPEGPGDGRAVFESVLDYVERRF